MLVITLVQLLPCIVLGSYDSGALVERWGPARSLVAGYGLQTVALGGVAATVATHAPYAVAVALSPFITLSITITRPAQSAVLPAAVRTAEELTAANVMTGWTESAAALVGPGRRRPRPRTRRRGRRPRRHGGPPLGSLLLTVHVVRRLARRGLATRPRTRQ